MKQLEKAARVLFFSAATLGSFAIGLTENGEGKGTDSRKHATSQSSKGYTPPTSAPKYGKIQPSLETEVSTSKTQYYSPEKKAELYKHLFSLSDSFLRYNPATYSDTGKFVAFSKNWTSNGMGISILRCWKKNTLNHGVTYTFYSTSDNIHHEASLVRAASSEQYYTSYTSQIETHDGNALQLDAAVCRSQFSLAEKSFQQVQSPTTTLAASGRGNRLGAEMLQYDSPATNNQDSSATPAISFFVQSIIPALESLPDEHNPTDPDVMYPTSIPAQLPMPYYPY